VSGIAQEEAWEAYTENQAVVVVTKADVLWESRKQMKYDETCSLKPSTKHLHDNLSIEDKTPEDKSLFSVDSNMKTLGCNSAAEKGRGPRYNYCRSAS